MKKNITILLLAIVTVGCCMAQLPIGKWRAHYSYNTATTLAESRSTIYSASPLGIVTYDIEDYTLGTLTSANGLSDAGIATIAYDTLTESLVVAYDNANIDIRSGNTTYNLSDLKRSDIAGDKSIHHIRFHNHHAYLACGFGIVVLDLKRHEIKETYYLGNGGTHLSVVDIAFTNDDIVAATDKGLFHAPVNDAFLNITSHWKPYNDTLLDKRNIIQLEVADNRLLVLAFDYDPLQLTLYQQNSDSTFAPRDSGDIHSVRLSHGDLVVSHWEHVDIYPGGRQHNPVSIDTVDWLTVTANDALQDRRGVVWIANPWVGLTCVEDLKEQLAYAMLPEGPANDNVYRLVADRDKLYVCPGGIRTTYEGMFLAPSISWYQTGKWHTVNRSARQQALRDILAIAIDPFNHDHYVATSWGVGVADFIGNEMQALYDDTNSDGAIERYRQNDYTQVFTGDVAYDADGDCWITNSLVGRGLAVHRHDGTWKSFNTAALVGTSDINHIVCDSVNGYKWFFGRANKIFVHDGVSQYAYIDPNNGSKKNTASVNCLVQDHNGDLWMGTNNGIKVVYDGYRAFDGGGKGEKAPVNCSNIIIGNGDFVEYLMAYENITCIAVDGANRKWVGTANGGLYLVASNGLEELEHFTMENSPLPSNKIVTVAVVPYTGEVFVGTDRGILSYRGTATDIATDDDFSIHAFPNPVSPDYDGPVAINGFANNAMVHITDAGGHVIYSTQAYGGQAVWHCRTNDGRRVASGVYYVFASDSEGGRKAVTKILVVR